MLVSSWTKETLRLAEKIREVLSPILHRGTNLCYLGNGVPRFRRYRFKLIPPRLDLTQPEVNITLTSTRMTME